ncbi:hypothetical protein BKA93DRAFT_2561 [Sparassis latifolia]
MHIRHYLPPTLQSLARAGQFQCTLISPRICLWSCGTPAVPRDQRFRDSVMQLRTSSSFLHLGCGAAVGENVCAAAPHASISAPSDWPRRTRAYAPPKASPAHTQANPVFPSNAESSAGGAVPAYAPRLRIRLGARGITDAAGLTKRRTLWRHCLRSSTPRICQCAVRLIPPRVSVRVAVPRPAGGPSL